MYKIWWKFKKKKELMFLLFQKGTIIKTNKKNKQQCPKVKSGQEGFCFGKRTTLIFMLTGLIVFGTALVDISHCSS